MGVSLCQWRLSVGMFNAMNLGKGCGKEKLQPADGCAVIRYTCFRSRTGVIKNSSWLVYSFCVQFHDSFSPTHIFDVISLFKLNLF